MATVRRLATSVAVKRLTVALAVALAAVAALTAVARDVPLRGAPAQPLARTVGSGPTAAVVLRPPGAPPRARLATVVFLHGWGGVRPAVYGPWLLHLLAGGRQVIYPVYQQPPFLSPQAAFADAVAGLRAALRVAPADPEDVVAAGHSAGGALAEDLAAGARRLGLPQPRAVLAAYPGRGFVGSPPVPARGHAARRARGNRGRRDGKPARSRRRHALGATHRRARDRRALRPGDRPAGRRPPRPGTRRRCEPSRVLGGARRAAQTLSSGSAPSHVPSASRG